MDAIFSRLGILHEDVELVTICELGVGDYKASGISIISLLNGSSLQIMRSM